jgi:hypothetical protein
VSDLGTRNGTEAGGLRLRGESGPLAPGGLVRVGRTRLRVRTAAETLAPEQPDGRRAAWITPAAERRALAAVFAATVGVTVLETWTVTPQPRELATALVTAILVSQALAILWIALWALASRVAFGESRWARHALVAFAAYAGLSVTLLVLQIVNGGLGLHLPPALGMVVTAAACSAALAAHLVNATPRRRRVAAAIGVAIPAVILVATLWVQARQEARSPDHVADRDHVLPPALLLRPAVPLERFTAELAALPARADAHRAFVEREDPAPGEYD